MERLNLSLACACNGAESSTEPVKETDSTMSPQEKYLTLMAERGNQREGNLHETDGYHCELCKNRGYTVKTEYTDLGYWANIEHECICMSVRRNINRMNRSGLKDVITKCRFDTYRTDEPWQMQVKTMAQEYVQHLETGSGWFFVGGASGAGKSHICTAICRELLHKGREARYMLWRDESTKLKAIVNDAAQYEKLISELKNVEVLYIDDFFKCGQNEGGSQKPTAADISLAFEILNYRYNHPDAITILSSESTLDEIFRMDEAVGGRIGERAGRYIISLTGTEKSYRRKLTGMAV